MARLQQGFPSDEMGVSVKLYSSTVVPLMSPSGHKRTLRRLDPMSALLPESGHGVPGDIISKRPGDFVGILAPLYSEVIAYPSE
jgi:hypothetical protein